MDALFSYLLFSITLKIIVIELAIMLFCCLLIVATKIIAKWREDKRKRLQETISASVEKALFPTESKQPPMALFSLPKKNYGLRNFVEVLEKYEERFTDERWDELKKGIWERYLAKEAKAFVDSRSWIKRQLSARAYRLYPEKLNHENLNKFIEDPKNLVKIVAATTVPKTPYKDLFYKVICKMSEETKLSQFFYRDALIHSDPEKFGWMEELLKKEENPKIIAILLDILSTRYTKDLFPLIRPFAVAEDRLCRILAIRAIGSIASDDSVQILMSRLSDSDWEVRAESVIGLKNQHEDSALPQFAQLLNDPIWWVRLQAAKALESFGKEGDLILRSQSAKEFPKAHEMAAYVLSLQGSHLS